MVSNRSSYFVAILIAIISASTINVAAIGMFDTSTQIFHPSFHTLQSMVATSYPLLLCSAQKTDYPLALMKLQTSADICATN